MPFVHEGVDADALRLTEIFKRTTGIKGISAHLEFLAITCSMDFFRSFAVDVGEFHVLHDHQNAIMRGLDVVQRETPVDDVLQFIFGDIGRNLCHFADTDAAPQPHDSGKQRG